MGIAPGRLRLLKIARNIMSLVGSNAVNRATSFVVYAGVARYLGARPFGQLLLAVSLFQLFSRFAGLGLRDLVTREISKNRDLTGRYLGNASLLVGGATVVASLAILALVAILGYPSDTVQIILLLFLGLLPFAISRITEAVFIAWERTQYVAYVNIPMNLVQTGVALWLLVSGASVFAVVISIIVSYAAMAYLHWVIIARMSNMAGPHLDFGFSRQLLQAALPFFGMQATIAISASVNIVLISKFVGEIGVGIYAAASQLLVPLAVIMEATAAVLFPTMVRKSKAGLAALKRFSRQAVEFTIAFVCPAVLVLATLGSEILGFIYGSAVEFNESATVLSIIVWSQFGLSITGLFARVLLTSDRETTLLRILAIRTGIQLVVATLLIWQFGVIGAAVSSIVVSSANALMHYVPVARLLSGFGLVSVAWRPALASAAAAAFLMATSDLSFLVRFLGGGAIYLAVLAALIAASPGGFSRFLSRDTFGKPVENPEPDGATRPNA